MATTYTGSHIDLGGLAEADHIERVASAIGHEFAAIEAVNLAEETRSSHAGPIWPWKSIMNAEIATHYAFVGEEQAARTMLERTSSLSVSDRFKARFSIWQAFRQPEDHQLLRQEAGDSPRFPIVSDQRLEVVCNDVAEGIDDGLLEYVAGIPDLTERTIGHIVLADNSDEMLELRDAHKAASRLPEDDRNYGRSNMEIGLIRVNLASAVMGADTHDEAMALLSVDVRPDIPYKETTTYISTLLASGDRDKVEEVLEVVDREEEDKGDRRRLELFVAQTTMDPKDIERTQKTADGLGNKCIKAHHLADLVDIYVDTGDFERAEAITSTITEPLHNTSPHKRNAQINLFRGYLLSGNYETAERFYSSAVYGGAKGPFIDGRLMLARFLRTDNPATRTLSF